MLASKERIAESLAKEFDCEERKRKEGKRVWAALKLLVQKFRSYSSF
jgi:hypothetical protein